MPNVNDPHMLEADPSTRVIVNSQRDRNTTNIVDMDAEKEHICQTLRTCQAVLKAHCGPKSGYAMLVNNFSAGTDFEPNVFTRDGIRILSAIEFMSPLEKYIKELIAYVGSRVDSNAKDGTTTSMLFASVFLEELLQRKQEIDGSGLSFYQINQTIRQLFRDVLTDLQEYTFTIKKWAKIGEDEHLDEDVACHLAGQVALMQALSSSGGNLELALAMKEIFEKSPPSTWEFISSYRSAKENGLPFSIEVDSWDGRIRCTTATFGSMNHALGTEFVANDADVLVFADAITQNDFRVAAMTEFLEKYPTDKTLLIITTASGILPSIITKLNSTRQVPLTLWEYAPEQRNAGQQWPWELMVLAAKAGITPFSHCRDNMDPSKVEVIHCSEVHWHDTYLDLYGFLPEHGDSCVHPYYKDREHAPWFYRTVLEEVEKQLDLYRNGHRPDGRTYGFFVQIANDLACVHRPTLRLGGPAHEQIANNDVVQDVQGATMSALNHGFLVNGSFGLYAVTANLAAEAEKQLTQAEQEQDAKAIEVAKLRRLIASALRSAIEAVLRTLFGSEFFQDTFILARLTMDPDSYINGLDDTCSVRSVDEFRKSLKHLTATSTTQDDLQLGSIYPVLQPVMITEELLKRTQELLIKFLSTNKIIVYGGVVVNPSQEEA